MTSLYLILLQGYFGMNFDDFKGIQHSDGYAYLTQRRSDPC